MKPRNLFLLHSFGLSFIFALIFAIASEIERGSIVLGGVVSFFITYEILAFVIYIFAFALKVEKPKPIYVPYFIGASVVTLYVIMMMSTGF